MRNPTLPIIDWDSMVEYAKVVWDSFYKTWGCPHCLCGNSSRRKCKNCNRVRVELREGYGPRGGELFGWYMKVEKTDDKT